nr:hypothetical protein CFP56_00517 [Quercus suber]
MIHPLLAQLLNQRCALFHELRKWNFARVIRNVFVVLAEHKLVHIDPRDSSLHAFGHDLGRKLVRAMQHDLHVAFRLVMIECNSGHSYPGRPLRGPRQRALSRPGRCLHLPRHHVCGQRSRFLPRLPRESPLDPAPARGDSHDVSGGAVHL